MKIQEVDKNFAIALNLSRTDVRAYNVCEEPFKIHGLIPRIDGDDRFRRMPKEIADSVNEGVAWLHSNTAGGRVRFKTDSDYIAICASIPPERVGRMCHFPLTGSAGFDLYTEIDGRQVYLKTFVPPYDMEDGYQSEFDVPDAEMREYTINFPLYSDVLELSIILSDTADVLPAEEYKYSKPVVYYGSSITQGGCASRPGNAYESIVSRVLGCDHINLGFSGNAKGEDIMAEYVASLDMCAFVYDYDYNAPTPEHLKATHGRMFDIVRKAHPDIPIICVSRPISRLHEDAEERRQIIINTVKSAKENGDKNVYFIDGADFGKKAYVADSISVDGCHPNDLGFACMAEVIGEKLKEIMNW